MESLRKLFGPSRHEIWQQLSNEIGAHFVDGGFWKGDKVEVAHGPWTITLDKYVVSNGKSSVTYTRMRALYVNPDGFRFTVYRKGLFSDMGKWFGMQDLVIGDEEFDRDFILKSNSEVKLRQLLSQPRIRELIARQPDIHFEARHDEGFLAQSFPEGVDELCFQVVGVIKDIERLKLLYELFSETLDQLCRIGSAYQTEPNVSL